MSLISVEDLRRRLGGGARDLRVVDVRWYLNREGDGRRAYDAGHIPTAIFLDLTNDLSAPDGAGRHPLPTPADFAHRLGAAGVGDGHMVVAYDDAGGANAARLWWMLDNLGHRRVAVLDGGIQAWVAAGHALSTHEPDWPPAQLTLAGRWTNTIDRAELAGRLGTVTVLDARAPERYRGETEPIDPAAGHIPTAINAPTAGNLDADGRFLDADQLRGRFVALHNPAMPVVTSCGSGTTACHNALAMRLAGLPDPILYVGSFSDWSRSGMPVATGPEPVSGDKPPRANSRPRSWQEMREQEIKWLIERTGEGLEAWNQRIRDKGFSDEASLRTWLTEQGVTGYPRMLLVMERFGYPDYLTASADDLIEGQYADRPDLRPILDAVLTLLPELGQVEIQARKTYVALLTPRRTFAAVQPTTRKRVDLGLRLTADQRAEGRLEPAPNFGQSSVTHKIGLASADDVDDEVAGWLRRAYEASS